MEWQNDGHRTPLQRLNTADIILAAVGQSREKLRFEDFTPLPCGDPNCATIGYLLRTPGGGTRSISDFINFADVQNFLHDKVRYSLDDLSRCGCESEPLGELLHQFEMNENNCFRLFIKPFMDAWTWDEDRIDRCCTHVIRPRRKAGFVLPVLLRISRMKELLRFMSFGCPLLPSIFLLSDKTYDPDVNRALMCMISSVLVGVALYFFGQKKEDQSGSSLVDAFFIIGLLTLVVTPVVYFAGCACSAFSGIVCEPPSWWTLRDVNGLPRWPAVPLEIAFNVFAVLAFLILRKKRLLTGQHFHLYLIAYGIFRLVHEFMRATPKIVFGFSGYQIAAVFLIIVGSAGFAIRRKRRSEPASILLTASPIPR